MGRSKVQHLDSPVHTPRTNVILTVNDPVESTHSTISVAASVITIPEEVLAVLAEMRQANPRNQPIRYETLQRWVEVLERHVTPSL